MSTPAPGSNPARDDIILRTRLARIGLKAYLLANQAPYDESSLHCDITLFLTDLFHLGYQSFGREMLMRVIDVAAQEFASQTLAAEGDRTKESDEVDRPNEPSTPPPSIESGDGQDVGD